MWASVFGPSGLAPDPKYEASDPSQRYGLDPATLASPSRPTAAGLRRASSQLPLSVCLSLCGLKGIRLELSTPKSVESWQALGKQ